jgi:V/A-type H+-transporting ATPase subunit D
MVEPRGLPSGRAGRLWLVRRLHAGRRAAELLDRKVQVLLVERERFARRRDRTGERWREAWRLADRWGLRGTMVSGLDEVRRSAPSALARVAVTWASAMGVTYPATVDCRVPVPSGSDRGPGSVGLAEAATAYRRAVAAAADHAAATAACRLIETEIDETRRRRRAITDRWIPALEARLARLRQELDETEREEIFRRQRTVAGDRR